MLYTLALLACPIGMALMMLLMGRGVLGGRRTEKRPDQAAEAELTELRTEQGRLAGQIEALEARGAREPAVR